ncbi:hypothetical protein SK128_007984, partial [Halocaridina rubra]
DGSTPNSPSETTDNTLSTTTYAFMSTSNYCNPVPEALPSTSEPSLYAVICLLLVIMIGLGGFMKYVCKVQGRIEEARNRVHLLTRLVTALTTQEPDSTRNSLHMEDKCRALD